MFSRNFLVGVERRSETILRAHGALDDDIYTLKLDVEVRLPDLEISSVKGEFERYTHHECEGAPAKLQNAVGLRLRDEDFSTRVKRVVGREGCRHFADLLLECCDAVVQEANYGGWREFKEKGLSKDEFRRHMLETSPGIRDSCMVYSQNSEMVRRLGVEW